jgi:hypothetical protein
MSESKTLICPLLTNDVIVAVMNAKTDSFPKVTTIIPAIPREANDDATIISGASREKRHILEAYKTKFGTGYPDSIIRRKKGKLVGTTLVSHPTRRMIPSKDKFIESISWHYIASSQLEEEQYWIGGKQYLDYL